MLLFLHKTHIVYYFNACILILYSSPPSPSTLPLISSHSLLGKTLLSWLHSPGYIFAFRGAWERGYSLIRYDVILNNFIPELRHQTRTRRLKALVCEESLVLYCVSWRDRAVLSGSFLCWKQAMAYRPRQPAVVLTAFQKQGSLDAYLHEVRSIRESRMFQPRDEDTEDGEAP